MKKALGILWKTLKVVLIVLAVLIVAILAGALGPIVKWTAPTIAKCMGAEVSIEECSILPLGGYVKLGGLRVENPTVFRTQNAKVYDETPLAQVGNLEIDFAMRSLFGKEYVVDKIELSGLRALYAFDYDTTNVDALMDEMGLKKPTEATTEEAVSEVEAEVAEAETEEVETTPAEKKAPQEVPEVRLAYVNISDNSVTIRKYMNFPVVIPPMTLEDTSTSDLKARMGKTLEPALKALKGVGDTLGKGLDTATDAIGTGVNTATDAIGTGVNAATNVLGDGLNVTTDALGTSVDTTVDALEDSFNVTKEALGTSIDSAKESFKDLKGLLKKKKK
jgi:hypothetical protein